MPASPIFDAHLHIVDPRFPLVRNRGFVPEPFPVEAYRRRVASLGVAGGAVVSASFQGFDQAHLVDALGALGPGFVGVTQLPPDVTDAEIRRLAGLGVRGLRFNLHRGDPIALTDLERLARRAYDLAGWHAELYVDARELADHVARVAALPEASLDHLGLSAAGLPTVLRLAEQGVRVKATGFGRVGFDVPEALRRIAAVNPEALLFGTDLPSTRAPRPFRDGDVALVEGALGPSLARRVLHDNAAAFYGR